MIKLSRLLVGTVLMSLAATAFAHPGHGSSTLFDGLVHPFGLDHLLAMLAVGVWSVAALPAGKRLLGPTLFVAAMLAGACAGAAGLGLPMLELGIAASLAIFGAMLMAPRALPLPLAMLMLAGAAALHGLAHGAEAPSSASFQLYALGFVVTTAALHGLGLGLGQLMARLHVWTWRLAGAGLGLAGLMLMSRV